MTFTPRCGEIVHVFAPSVGYRKYHICLGANAHGTFLFLFLNSENGYVGDCIFPCAEFPTVPVSDTGETVVSFSMLPRFTEAQLNLHGAQSFGFVAQPVAQKLRDFLDTTKTLSKPDKANVLTALDSLL